MKLVMLNVTWQNGEVHDLWINPSHIKTVFANEDTQTTTVYTSESPHEVVVNAKVKDVVKAINAGLA